MTNETRQRWRPRFNTFVAEALETMFSTRPAIRGRSMFGHPAFFSGTRMFACVWGDGVALKLPPARGAALIGAGRAVPFEPHGRAMRGWVVVPCESAAAARKHAALLHEAIASLEAK